MWLSPHRCVLLHISVEITKHVWENPHRQVLGFFHTCLVKHTHRLISPWANGELLPQQVESEEVALEYKKFDIDEDEGKVGDEADMIFVKTFTQPTF